MKKDIILSSLNFSILEQFGFVKLEELDFHNGGSKYKVFSYKGIPISYCKWQGTVYLSVRPDYCVDKFPKKLNIVRLKTPLNWWNSYKWTKTVTVVNAFTGETITDELGKIIDMYNMSSSFSVGFLMGICEFLVKEFPIAQKEYKKDIKKKRKEFEPQIKKELQKGVQKINIFLCEIQESYSNIKNDISFFEHNAFKEYYDRMKYLGDIWEDRIKEMPDDIFYKVWESIKDNKGEIKLSEIGFWAR